MTAALLRSPVFWLRVVSVLVVVSVALGLARLTWRLSGWDDGRTEIWTPVSLAPVGGSTGSDQASVLAWAPFGGGGAGGDLPISSLGLVLRGVIYSGGGGSTALISNGGAPVQVFAVGEAPVGNAVIEAIEMDRVVLNVGGRREALVLPNPAGTALPGAPTPATPTVTTAPSAPSAPAVSPEAQAALASASPIATAAAAARASALPSRAPTNATPSEAVSALGVTPSPQGYVVSAGSAAHLLRAGLRPGDVIKSLNGQPLGDPASDQQAFQRAAAGGRARVEVVRNGRTLTLTVPLR